MKMFKKTVLNVPATINQLKSRIDDENLILRTLIETCRYKPNMKVQDLIHLVKREIVCLEQLLELHEANYEDNNE